MKVKVSSDKKYESRIAHITALRNGIIRVDMKSGVELEAEDLDENMQIYEKILGKGNSGLFLLVFQSDGSSSKEGREKFASLERSKIKKAEALVINTISHRMESNFYKNFFNPKHPVRIFDNELNAIDWLLSFESESNEGKYETAIASIYQIEDDIIKIKVKQEAVIDENGLKENLAVFQQLIPNGGYFLSIFQETNTANKDVKPSFESPNRTKLKKGEAFVIQGLSNRIELEYYIHRTKQLYPTEVFENEEDALHWLRSIKAGQSS